MAWRPDPTATARAGLVGPVPANAKCAVTIAPCAGAVAAVTETAVGNAKTGTDIAKGPETAIVMHIIASTVSVKETGRVLETERGLNITIGDTAGKRGPASRLSREYRKRR